METSPNWRLRRRQRGSGLGSETLCFHSPVGPPPGVPTVTLGASASSASGLLPTRISCRRRLPALVRSPFCITLINRVSGSPMRKYSAVMYIVEIVTNGYKFARLRFRVSTLYGVRAFARELNVPPKECDFDGSRRQFGIWKFWCPASHRCGVRPTVSKGICV